MIPLLSRVFHVPSGSSRPRVMVKRRRGGGRFQSLALLFALIGSHDAQRNHRVEYLASSLDQANAELEQIRNLEANAAWNASVEINLPNQELLKMAQTLKESWKYDKCQDFEDLLKKINPKDLFPVEKRQIWLFCRGPRYTPDRSRRFEAVQQELYRIYHASLVCYGDFCEHGEPDLARRMEQSRDPQFLLTIWDAWRRMVGPRGRPLYRDMVQIMNQAARDNGYGNVAETWMEQLDMPNIKGDVERLHQEILPFYRKLHAYTRHRLGKFYGQDDVDPHQAIPAHLLGNMWAQSWENIADIVVPASLQSQNPITLEKVVLKANLTVLDMVESADDYFQSMGFRPATPSFWSKSQFVRPSSAGIETGSCHPSSLDLYDGDDFRMELCGDQSLDTFLTIHHEMGHIQYYMNYHHQPPIFRDGANPAFHESIGDCINYGIQSPAFLRNFGITIGQSRDELVVSLLQQALQRIPLIIWSLVVDQWRWDVFEEKVTYEQWNDHWWHLRSSVQGIESPLPRHPDAFDPMAKFHIPDNTPYMPYFMAGFLQIQFFDQLCRIEYGESIDVNECDLYGAKKAGATLRHMMSLGQSRPWKEVLWETLGMTEISSEPLLNYYAPLIEWLDQEVAENDIPLGW